MRRRVLLLAGVLTFVQASRADVSGEPIPAALENFFEIHNKYGDAGLRVYLEMELLSGNRGPDDTFRALLIQAILMARQQRFLDAYEKLELASHYLIATERAIALRRDLFYRSIWELVMFDVRSMERGNGESGKGEHKRVEETGR